MVRRDSGGTLASGPSLEPLFCLLSLLPCTGSLLVAATKPAFLLGRDSLVWSRHYSAVDESSCDCSILTQALQKAGAERMVVGHTIQDRQGAS